MPTFRSLTATTMRSPLSLPFLADAAAPVLEQLDLELVDVGVPLDIRHCGDDDDVTGRGHQRLDAALELRLARGVDDAGEVVDRAGELGRRWLRDHRSAGDEQAEDEDQPAHHQRFHSSTNSQTRSTAEM